MHISEANKRPCRSSRLLATKARATAPSLQQHRSGQQHVGTAQPAPARSGMLRPPRPPPPYQSQVYSQSTTSSAAPPRRPLPSLPTGAAHHATPQHSHPAGLSCSCKATALGRREGATSTHPPSTADTHTRRLPQRAMGHNTITRHTHTPQTAPLQRQPAWLPNCPSPALRSVHETPGRHNGRHNSGSNDSRAALSVLQLWAGTAPLLTGRRRCAW